MRRFLIVGCGGSGGRTVRLLIDQLRADLRARGISELPDAWQFVHIDVPVDPDKGPAPLGSIRDLGGQYVSFSSPTNTYLATANAVEAQLGAKGNNFAPLMGWAPRDRETANGIPVNNGAGQYRAVGRMLTLPRLGTLHETMVTAQARAVAPNAWGEIPRKEQTSNVIIPIVLGSMAGGSGASMFLDVCRVLGSLPGVKPQNIGAFLFTADVFAELPSGLRANVEGNAMGALPEILGAITRLSEPEQVLSKDMTLEEVGKLFMGQLDTSTMMSTETKDYGSVWGEPMTTWGLVGAATWLGMGNLMMKKMISFRF